MKANIVLLTSLLLFSIAPTAFSQSADTVVVNLEAGENVWGGRIADGSFMPYKAGFEGDMYNDRNNQIQPLLLTDKGRYVWSEEPYRFFIRENRIVIVPQNEGTKLDLKTGFAGKTLAEAHSFASNTFFPASGIMPPEEFFEVPQYNTWIELLTNCTKWASRLWYGSVRS